MAKKRVARKPTGKKPPPKCKAILLCNHTIIEAVTGKVSIIGIFDNFGMPTFPGLTSAFTVYLQLTDGIGKYSISVELHDLVEDTIVGRAAIAEIEFQDRSQKANLMIPVPPLPLTHAGVYDFVVLADGQEIDRQQFSASAPGSESNAQNPTEEPDER
jgi:hypothetical protein